MQQNKRPAIDDNSLPARLRLIRGGKDYFDCLLHLIGNAKHTIHLQTYIFDADETGNRVATALKNAAARNVQVYLLADGYASQSLPQHFIDGLRESGVQFRFFEPFFKGRHFYFGRRLHHKVMVADEQQALVGGLNISDRYNDTPGKPAWLDFAILAEGPVARKLCILCSKTWNGFQSKQIASNCSAMPPSYPGFNGENARVRMRRNDWIRHKNEISGTYIQMFRHARSHITILSSYFLPGKILRRLLSAAARRGVIITVITAGPSDVMLAKHAERWLYDWLLRNHIRLYEYQPTVLHAKVSVCDGEWFTLGSYNLNNISAYASIELNLDIFDKTAAAGLEAQLQQLIENDCIAITPEKHKVATNIFVQLLRWSAYASVRIIFYMLTFYFKQKSNRLLRRQDV